MPIRRRSLVVAVALAVLASVCVVALQRQHHRAPAVDVSAGASPRAASTAEGIPDISVPTSTSTTSAEQATAAAGIIAGRARTTAPPPPDPPVTVPPVTVPPVTVPPILERPDRLAFELMKRGSDGNRRPNGIAVMNADGTDRRVLTSASASGPQWSPGGKYVLVTVESGSAEEHNLDGHIVALPSDGGEEVTLTRGFSAGLSADGRKLLYTPFNGAPDMRIVDVSWAGTPRVIEASAVTVPQGGYSWSPTGTALSFVKPHSREDWTGDLWRMQADGTGARQLTSDLRVGMNRWSPDGLTIAFSVEAPEGGRRTSFVDALGGSPRPATSSYSGDFTFAWAHHRNLLVVVANGGLNLLVVNTSGDVIHDVRPPANMFPMFAPTWSADDDALYYLAMPRDHVESDPNLYVVDVNSSNGRQITTDASIFAPPAVVAR